MMVLANAAGFWRPAVLIVAAGLALSACAGNRSEIGAQIESMGAGQSDAGAPVNYVELFPGGGDNCGYPTRDARVWNTHPVRAIKASFARILPSGARDYFNIEIPAGQIVTVAQCTVAEPELVTAQFVDQS